MRRPRRALCVLVAGLVLVAIAYVYIWEESGDIAASSQHHLLAANDNQIKRHDVTVTSSTDLESQPVPPGTEVKTGERQPQGVAAVKAQDGNLKEEREQQQGEQEEREQQDVEEREQDIVDRAKRRAAQYCGPPDDNLKGEEGNVPPDYHLEHVHIIIRHGDRSPLYALPGYELPWISCDVNITMAKTDPVVRSYLTTMKTLWSKLGRNSQAFRFGLYPHSRYCEGSQLTGTGALQHIRNGQHLSQVYLQGLKLFDADNISHHLKVISTEVSRTYQSAVAFLFGFLPVFDLSKIPMTFSRTLTFCSHTLSGFTCDCHMAHKLDQIIKKEYNKRIKNLTLHNEIKQTVAEVLHVPKSHLPWLSALSDGFNGHTCHDLPLPCSRQEPHSCITWATIGKLWEFLDINGAWQLSSYAYQKQQRLLMHPLLHIILHRMQNVTRGAESSRFVLYSGHDKTLTPLVTALGIHDGRWPRYASRVIFELYSKTEDSPKQRTYYIKVLFNGKDRTKHVRFCKGKTIEGLCPLSYFHNFIFQEELQYFGKPSYAEACRV